MGKTTALNIRAGLLHVWLQSMCNIHQ